MNSTNQDHDETSVAENKAADTDQTQVEAPLPTSRPAENSTDSTVPKPDLTWDLSDWMRIS